MFNGRATLGIQENQLSGEQRPMRLRDVEQEFLKSNYMLKYRRPAMSRSREQVGDQASGEVRQVWGCNRP
jgi:hypothetical protein